jgi:Rrf2 family nitric oxide-sensitive transcriptional repressor
MLSQTAEYALRAMVLLASSERGALTTEKIARGSQVPAGYLSKILHMLVKAGLITSQRGLGGGYALRRPPEEINLLDIVNTVDLFHRIDHCPLGIDGHGKNLCPLHRRINEAVEMIEEVFRTTSLASISAGSQNTHPFSPTDD